MVANLHGAKLVCYYDPDNINTTYSFSIVSRNETAYTFDSMTFNQQNLLAPIPKLLAKDSAATPTHVLLNGILPYGEFQYIPGTVQLAHDNSANNVGITTLFQVVVSYYVTFYMRL